MSLDPLIAALSALDDKGIAAGASGPQARSAWLRDLRKEPALDAFAEAAIQLGGPWRRLADGGHLAVTSEAGGYGVSTPDATWLAARMFEDVQLLGASPVRLKADERLVGK